jgi:hypothetical protein
MLNHLRERVTQMLSETTTALLSTHGEAGLQAGTFPCEADGLCLYLLVPRTSDHLFNLEHASEVVITTDDFQLRGTACVVSDCPAGLDLRQRPDAAWCEVVRVDPSRLQIEKAGESATAETIDMD